MSTADPPPPATTDPPPQTIPPGTTTTTVPITTNPPVTTQNPPTRTTEDPVTIPPPKTTREPPKTTDPYETTPYTTQYITTVSVITITTVVPHTTMISGTVTTVYDTLITTTQTPTVIPDPHQAPPPLGPAQNWPNRGHLQTWQIATIIIAVLALFSACASVVLLGWMRKKRKEDDVLAIGLEPWDEEKKGASVDEAQHQQQLQQHVHGSAGSSGDPQGYNSMWATGAGPGAPFGHSQDGSGSTCNSGYPDPRGYSSDMYAYNLTGGGGEEMGSGVSEADYSGLYGGLVMSPQQQAQSLPHGHGGTGYGRNYHGEQYLEGTGYYSTNQPRVQYPTPPSHNNTSPTSAVGLLRHESRAMESMDYVDGYGLGQEEHVGIPSRQSTVDYLADADSRRESHDGTQESATLGRLDSWRGPGGVNLLWDDPSKDRGQRDLGGGGARGPEGEGDLNWKAELSRKSPQALQGEEEEVLEGGKGKGRAP